MSKSPGQPAAPDGLQEEFPGYARALAQEAESRDLAFLLGTPEPLCGLQVYPLDLRSLVALTHAENVFVCGGHVDIEEVRMLLWLQNPGYRPGPAARDAFVGGLPEMDEAQACADVRTWVQETFNDAPPSDKVGRTASGVVIVEPIASFVASWVDLLASEYGWTLEQIVGTAQSRGVPLRCIYQLYRCIMRRRDPKHPFSSAAIARLLGDCLRASIAEEQAQQTPSEP